MEQKKINPVEGRLGLPSPTGTGPHAKFTKRNSNYGFGRLGITSDAESESAEPISKLTKRKKTPAPHTDVAKPITSSKSIKDKDIDRQAESAETPKSKHRYFTRSKLSKYKTIFARKKFLLFAGIPVTATVLLILFCFSGGETVPQVATAIEKSPPDKPTAKGAIKIAVKSPQNPLETAEHLTKHEPASPSVQATRQTVTSPASPITVKAQQDHQSGQTILTTTMARSALRETFKFLARLKPPPETTDSASVRTASASKPGNPQSADHEPTVKKVAATASASQLGIELGGIMRGSDGNFAIINKRFVRVGQTVNNAKIIRIGDHSVEIELKGKRYLIGISSSRQSRTSQETYSRDESSGSDDNKTESKTENEEKEQ